VLRISEGAVRKRVTRGTLKHEKEQDGRIYVYLDAGARRRVDKGVDPNTNTLISQLRDEVAYLRDENRRKDEIIMQQAMTMRQLAAAQPQEPSEASESIDEEPESAAPRPTTGESQESVHTTASDASRTLPFWGYVLGLILTGMTEFLLTSSYSLIVRPIFGGVVPEDVLLVVTVVLPLAIPIIFGFWVGRNYKGTNLWARLGATVALILAASLLLSRVLLDISIVARGGSAFFPEMFPTIWLWPVSIAFLSSALIGYVIRRRVVGYTTGAGSVSKQWSPLTLTLIGTAGNILAAVITGIFALTGT
jgi:hypothetical protein